MTTRVVDVFDVNGARLLTYSIAMEDADCLDAEFEEAALVFAESSGLVPANEIGQLRACCEMAITDEQHSLQPTSKRRTSAVVSLVRHRMKRASVSASGRNPGRALQTK